LFTIYNEYIPITICCQYVAISDKIKMYLRWRASFTGTKIAAAKKEVAKARAGKNSFPPTPFLFARPSVPFWFCRAKLGNQSGFCSK
jgi:hypothetical protein